MSELAALPNPASAASGLEAPEGIEGTARSSHSDWMRWWPEIGRHLAARPRLLLALGFDGILSPTVSQPREATLSKETQALLAKLGACPRITLAFLSGRSLADVRDRVGIAKAFYVGNHGMEIRGPGLVSSDGLAVSCRSDLVDAVAFLARCTKRLRGVFIEDKGMTVTVHWRLADAGEGVTLRGLMEIIVKSHPRLRVFAGEACWELRARASWNKGDALRQILAHLHLSAADAIYIGEEFTDADAFLQLPGGLTFCLNKGTSTAARYSLSDRVETEEFLRAVLSSVNGEFTR